MKKWLLLISAVFIFIFVFLYTIKFPVFGEQKFFKHSAVYAFCNINGGWDMDNIAVSAEKHNQEQNYISDMVSQMTLEQKLAQMMILTNHEDIAESKLSVNQPAGIILFSDDFTGKTIQQVKQQIAEMQAVMKIPLFVGVDEEGGQVTRIAGLNEEDMPVFPGARTLYENGGTEAVGEDTKKKLEILTAMDINLNFAPVADVVGKKTSYMYERSAGGEPETASAYVETVINTMKDYHVGSCLKHFPGYGENANTHQEYVTDNKKLSAYRKKYFPSFQRGIAAGADMVMVSHIVMKAVDENTPSSLSPAVHRLLREELGFQGVIMADDLNMQAILSQMSLEEAAARAFIAGNDMIFSADFNATMKGAQQAVREGRLSEEAIDASVTRILRMKMNLGLLTAPEE